MSTVRLTVFTGDNKVHSEAAGEYRWFVWVAYVFLFEYKEKRYNRIT